MDRRERLVLTILLGLVVGLDPLSIDTALPAAKVMATGLGTNMSSIQLSISLFVLGMAVGQLFHGPASDRFGRRPVMLAALVLYIAASAALALTPSVDMLIAARLIQGFAAAATQTVSRAIIRDRLDREAASQVLSYVFLILSIAPIFAPILGAQLTVAVGWRSVFWIMVVYGTLALVINGRWLEESNTNLDRTALDPSRLARNLATVASSRVFWAYVGCGAAAFVALFAFLIGSPAALIVFLDASPQDFSLYFAIVMVGNILGYPTGARLVARIGLDRLLMIGVFGGLVSALALAGLALAGVNTIAAIITPVFFYMFFFALTLPPATAGALSPFPKIAGAASSLLGFVQLGTAALCGAVVGAFENGTQIPMVVAITIAGIAGVIAFAAVRANARA